MRGLIRWVIGLAILLGVQNLNASVTFDQGDLLFDYVSAKSGQEVYLVGDITGWEKSDLKLQEISSGHYFLRIPSPWLPSLEYKFLVDGNWVMDIDNSRRSADGYGGWNSLAETGFEETDLIQTPASGKWSRTRLVFSYGKSSREVVVLVPNFLRKQKFPTLYFHDGGDYENRAFIQNILANYYRKTGKAFAAVLIPPVDRMNEYGASKWSEFDRWLAEDVVSEVEARFPLLSRPSARAVVGSSLGGLAAFREGLLSQTFGSVISQSGAFWYIENELLNLLNSRVQKPRVYLAWGVFEANGITEFNQKLTVYLPQKKFSTQTRTTPTLHNWLSWRNQLEEALNWFDQGVQRKK